MRQTSVLFGSLIETRDVLESFLRDEVLIPRWRETLAEAARQFIELGADPDSEELTDLGEKIAVLAGAELEQERVLTRDVAADVESLVDQVRVPDLPRPEDPDWSF